MWNIKKINKVNEQTKKKKKKFQGTVVVTRGKGIVRRTKGEKRINSMVTDEN